MKTMRESTVGIFLKLVLVTGFSVLPMGCGQEGVGTGGRLSSGDDGRDDISSTDLPEGSVLAATARVPIAVIHDGRADTIRMSTSSVLRESSNPVSITVSSSSKFEVDASEFFLPEPIEAELLSLGTLFVSEFFDNSLRICGVSGREKCRGLQIRMYTDESSGTGLYNENDGYGVPVFASLEGGSSYELGLGRSAAQVLQSVQIPANKNVLRLSDFAANPRYQVAVDFSNAGAGDYSTEIVIESLLTP